MNKTSQVDERGDGKLSPHEASVLAFIGSLANSGKLEKAREMLEHFKEKMGPDAVSIAQDMVSDEWKDPTAREIRKWAEGCRKRGEEDDRRQRAQEAYDRVMRGEE